MQFFAGVVSRAAARIVAAALLLLLTAVSAFSQHVELSISPATYGGANETMTYTLRVFPGSWWIYSVTPAPSAIKGVSLTCSVPGGGTDQPFDCIGTYQTTNDDANGGSFTDFASITGTREQNGPKPFIPLTSNSVTVTRAGGGPVGVSVSSSPNPSVAGQPVTVTATVSALGCNAGDAPPGTVTISLGTTTSSALTLVRTAPVSPSSAASFTVPNVAQGTYMVSASYSGSSGILACSPGSATGPDHVADTQPTVTINQAGSQSDPTGTSPINFSVVFDKNVIGFNTGDVQLSGTAGATTATVSGSGSTYNVAVSGMAQAGTVIATVPANVASASGLQNLASTSTDNTVNFVVITVNPASVPGATVGTTYNQTFTSTGGAGASTFDISAGALPAGLTLNGSGALTGTPTAAGTFNFTVRATDTNSISGTRAYALTVNPPTIILPATTLPDGTGGVSYSATLNPATGGTAPYSYAVTNGALPDGLTLNPVTGALSGTPTADGTFSFAVTATDSTTGSGAPYSSAPQTY